MCIRDSFPSLVRPGKEQKLGHHIRNGFHFPVNDRNLPPSLDVYKRQVIAIAAAAAVFVIGGGTAIALAATSPAPENPEFSEQEAKAAVFSHAGVSEQDVLSLRIDKGMENGSPVYEIDFTTAAKSYDYDIVRSCLLYTSIFGT